MDDKMYLTATAQGEVKVTGGRAEEKLGFYTYSPT